MEWIDYAYFFGGPFLNTVPHFASSVAGRAFQTPFAKPPGRGLPSTLNFTLRTFGRFHGGSSPERL